MTYRQYFIVWMLFNGLSGFSVQAVELTVEPTITSVQVGQRVNLSISGNSGDITWVAGKGQILGSGNQVTYIAPAQAGLDVVMVFDSEGNTQTIKVTVTLESNVSIENAQWEIFTNRQQISALALSEDGKTLWVGTTGGLEQRDGETGELKKVFTRQNGLPGNYVTTLSNDGEGGLWIGFRNEGLVYYTVNGQWIVFNLGDLGLSNSVETLLMDDHHNLWVSTGGELARYNVNNDQWVVFNPENSLPNHYRPETLSSDGKGGFWFQGWAGDKNFLGHYSVDGQWTMDNG